MRVWSKSARPRSALRLLLSMAALVDALYEVPIGSPPIPPRTFDPDTSVPRSRTLSDGQTAGCVFAGGSHFLNMPVKS